MKKRNRFPSLSRLFLWSHVIGVIGFYIVLWLRTAPAKEDRTTRQAPEPGSTTQPESSPLVSVIVPARNEERNIRRCVTSLLEQGYPNFEVIVVDDGSTDATPRILDEIAQSHPRGNRLFVLRLRDRLPPGWAGKPHAIYSGTKEARGEWLLLTDADTWHAPNALNYAVHKAIDEQVDLLSLGSRQELPGFWERVVMPMAYLGIMMQYPPRQVNDPSSPVALANGQFILIRRAVYDALGGYARPELRDTLLDDRDLARVIKRQGYRLRMFDGRDLVHVRMYRDLGETWRGWRKNAFLGSRGGLPFTIVALIGLPVVSIVPFLLPALAWMLNRFPISRQRRITGPEAGLATLLELTPLLAYRHWVNKELDVPWYYALTHPLAGAIFEGIIAQSAWRVLTHKGVDWSGRQYYNEKASTAGP
ncbi:MAG TPA: glycosyltransferase family 2 protein, partial [Ktedonobacteraceae bacterium]